MRPPPDFLAVARGVPMREDGQVLLVRRSSSDHHLPGLWEFPGGKVEKHDTMAETVLKETREETGLDLVIRSILAVVFCYEIPEGKYAGRIYLSHFYACRVYGNIEVVLSDEHEDHVWIEFDQILCENSPYQLVEETRAAAEQFSKNLHFFG